MYYCNPNGSLTWSCISHAHMLVTISFSGLSGLASTTTGSIYTNALTNQNPVSPMTFDQLTGLSVVTVSNSTNSTSLYPNITISNCSTGYNCPVGSICTSPI